VQSLAARPTPTWRARVSLFVWVLSFDLFGMDGPTGSYATAGIALRVIAPCKPPSPAIMSSSRWRYLKEDQMH